MRWHPLSLLMERAWLGVGPGKQPNCWGLGRRAVGCWRASWSGSAPGSSRQTPGRRGGRTLGAGSLTWKSCWHRHFPSSLSSFLSIHSTAPVYGPGGKLPLAPVCSINKKKRNRTRKRECAGRGERLKPKHREKAQLLSPRPSGAPARQPACPESGLYLFIFLA